MYLNHHFEVNFQKSWAIYGLAALMSSILSCQAMNKDPFNQSFTIKNTSPRLERTSDTTEDMFKEFIIKSRDVTSQVQEKQTKRLLSTVLNFAIVDCHYLETNPDTNQIAYKKLLTEEYYPLLDHIVQLAKGKMTQTDFFSRVLELYLIHLKDTANQARLARQEDENFKSAKGTFGIYTHGMGLNFFRDPTIVPTYEEFLSRNNGNLIQYWDPKANVKLSDSNRRKMKAKVGGELVKIHKDALALKERILPYRAAIEEYFNTLLHQSWQLVQDRTQLSPRTKKMLNAFEYLWPILKSGHDQNLNIDPLIKSYVFDKGGQLQEVLSVFCDSRGPSEEESVKLDKMLMPKKKKKKRKATKNKEVTSTPLISETMEGKIDPLKKDSLDIISRQEMQIDSSEEEDEFSTDLQDSHVKLNDNNAPAVSGVKGVKKESKKITTQDEILTPMKEFDDIRNAKHIKYTQVQKLFSALKGKKVRTNGSHETWEFPSADKKRTVSFGFWSLHGKDQYGRWTKQHILSLEEKLSVTPEKLN